MTTEYDVIVVGVGIMGAVSAAALARRGVRVLGLDRYDIPNHRGGSHGDTRMFRLCYYEHPDYVPLLRAAFDGWHATQQHTGRRLFHQTGGLYMAAAGREFVEAARTAAARHGIDHEMLDHATMAARYPQFRLPEDHIGLYEPCAGVLYAERAVSTFAELACRAGAELRAHEPATAWTADGSGATVTTHRGTFRARRLVFAGGGWSSAIMRDAGLPVTVTRQVLGWVWPLRPGRFELGVCPAWAIDTPDGTPWYGFPLVDGAPGFKLAHHYPAVPTTPDTVDRAITAADEADFRPCLERFIPDANGPLLGIRTCLYANTPDAHFIIDRHPAHANVTIATGFSGHGFNFAPVVGEIVADLATTGRTGHAIDFLSLRRFGGPGGPA
ncbi:MAG: N-methyl-L-tryptophan oxidase [Phycisphaerales bacterium]|nr:N-methyl-L-tryptophan oxidase [Phycisphaerales bacterium]